MAVDDLAALRIDGIAGSDERWTVPPDRALRLQNVEWDERGGWERCGGTGKILRDVQGVNPFVGQGKINSMHWFTRHGVAQQFLLFEMGAKLVYFDGSANSWVTLKTDRYTSDSPWQKTQYAAIGDNCWILNGVNEPLRFDGRTCHKAGFDGPAPSVTAECWSDGFNWGTTFGGLGLGDPGRPIAELLAAVQMAEGTNAYGEYAWVLTEINEFETESPPSVTYGSVKFEIQWTSMDEGEVQPRHFAKIVIPPPSHDGVVRRRLWRTINTFGLEAGEAKTYYLCADDIAGQGSFAYVDGLPDSALGEKLIPSNYGPFPRSAKFMCTFAGHTFYGGMADDATSLVYSTEGNPENVPASNRIDLSGSKGGAMTGMIVFRNALVVFMHRAIVLIMRGADGRLIDKMISHQRGCAAPNSLKEIPGVGLIFADTDGVYVFTGTLQEADDPAAFQRIDRGLGDTWKWKINRSALMNAWGEVYHHKNEYWLSVPYGGVPDNKMVLVYHYLTGTWSFRPNMNAACLVETHDHRGYLFLGSNDATGHPGVHQYSSGYTTMDGVAITAQYESAWLDLGGVYEHFTPRRIMARVLDYGNGSLTNLTYKNRRDDAAINVGGQTRTMTNAEYTLNARPVWGTAQWSTSATWSRVAPTVVTFSPGSGEAGAVSTEFKLVLSATSRCQFIGLRLDIDPGQRIPTFDPVLATGSQV